MSWADSIRYALSALSGARMRTALMLLAMSVGVAAVVVLTALGEGARQYIAGEFSSLGTNLLIVIPGRNETTGGGGPPPLGGLTVRDLTLDDALALNRSRAVEAVAPLAIGEAPASFGNKSRDSMIMGSTHELQAVRQLEIAQGRFLPAGDPRQSEPVCVIGETIRTELFGAKPALGQWLRVGDRRFRVVGIISQKGESLGANMDEVVVIPVASAQALFNSFSLFRILIQARGRDSIAPALKDVKRILAERHEGEEDVTVITQDSVLAAFDRIFKALTLTVAGIAAISLVVAGILVMNVMLVAVSQRTHEIGLLRALGATGRRIRILFLLEAGLLSVFGAALGLVIGWLGSLAIVYFFPTLPAQPPIWAVVAGTGIAVVTGILFAWMPSRRAARLDPVEALTRL